MVFLESKRSATLSAQALGLPLRSFFGLAACRRGNMGRSAGPESGPCATAGPPAGRGGNERKGRSARKRPRRSRLTVGELEG